MTNIPCNYCLIESNCSNKMKTQCSQLALFESENIENLIKNKCQEDVDIISKLDGKN